MLVESERQRMEAILKDLNRVDIFGAIFDEGGDIKLLRKYKAEVLPCLYEAARAKQDVLRVKAIMLVFYLKLPEAEMLLAEMLESGSKAAREAFFSCIDAVRMGVLVTEPRLQKALVTTVSCEENEICSAMVKSLGLIEGMPMAEFVPGLRTLLARKAFDAKDWAFLWLTSESTSVDLAQTGRILLEEGYSLRKWPMYKGFSALCRSDNKDVRDHVKRTLEAYQKSKNRENADSDELEDVPFLLRTLKQRE